MADNTARRSVFRAVVSEDPLATLDIGSRIPISPVVFGTSDATQIPDGVINWDFFQGSLLAVGVRQEGMEQIVGTAVMIGPGLALTATHVFAHVLDEMVRGLAVVFCIGIRTSGADLWKLRTVSYSGQDDLAYLALELMSPLTEGWCFSTIPLTTRCPPQGEAVTITGFRFQGASEANEREALSVAGDLFAASGTVSAVYFPQRDSVIMPYPVIEIECGSLGGMSGGAVLDRYGCTMGIISRGWDTEERTGPTYAAWVVGGLNRVLQIPWPPGMYSDAVTSCPSRRCLCAL